MGLRFVLWSIASVYISMLTSCLTLQNTVNLTEALLAGSSEICTLTTNQMGSKSSDFLSCFKTIFHQSCHFAKLFSPHVSLVSSLNSNPHVRHVECKMTLGNGNCNQVWCLFWKIQSNTWKLSTTILTTDEKFMQICATVSYTSSYVINWIYVIFSLLVRQKELPKAFFII